jgi:hypothetical protein
MPKTAESIMFIGMAANYSDRRSTRARGLGRCAIPLLLLIAGAAHASAIYKCVDAGGQVAFQANACPAPTRQTALELRGQPLIDPDARAVAPMRTPGHPAAAATHRSRGYPRAHHASGRVRARKQPSSWECRASDGEVFYRHARCPHSIAGDGVMRSSGVYVVGRGKGKRRGRHDAWSPLTVHARKVSRSEACKWINAAAAVERDGSARDERASAYEHDLGRDPCAGY